MIKIGLTGNYGMGKSTVLRAFGELGAFTISSDVVVAGLMEEPGVLARIRGLLGESVFGDGGRLLKQKVAEIIFADRSRKKALEEILHPLVFGKIEEIIPGAGVEMVLIEIPLLFEGGYAGRFTKTITVYADELTALDRLEKAGIDRKDAFRRIQSQMPIAEKIRRSDFTIDNNGSLEETMRRVRQIYGILTAGVRG